MPILRDGRSTNDHRLDRIPAFDDRSKRFRVYGLVDAAQPIVTKLWDLPGNPDGTPAPVLDQGQEGACTGFGVTNELRFNPVPVPNLDATFARQKIYWAAQKSDPWPGGAYPGAQPQYEGTGVLYAVKAAVKLGYYTAYHWAMSEPEMALGVSTLGPAVIGVNWYAGMYNADARNRLHVTGALEGGHCLLVIGVDTKTRAYTVYNSWGPTWGKQGTALISRTDMARLLHEDGECCIITGRAAGTN